jgi:SMI1-KNR4 cell-wall
MMTDVDSLISTLKPQSQKFAPIQWVSIEQQLQATLPSDYKLFVEAFGSGALDDFLRVLSPNNQNIHEDFTLKGEVLLRAYRSQRESFPAVFNRPTYPEPNGLLPWGYTIDGDTLFWRTSRLPERWTICLFDSIHDVWLDYDCSFSEFLMGLLNHSIVCPCFPKDFPGNAPFWGD